MTHNIMYMTKNPIKISLKKMVNISNIQFKVIYNLYLYILIVIVNGYNNEFNFNLILK